MELSELDRQALLRAKQTLEHPGLASRATDLLGYPIERSLESLPESVQRAIATATQAALRVALQVAVSTLDREADRGQAVSSRWHQVAGGVAGAAGGFFGWAALPAELPISTVIMLRSIASIARGEGEDLHELETRLACLEVLGLGGGRSGGAETGYYAARVGLAQSFKKTVEHIGRYGLHRKLAPPVADFIARIAARFSVQVSQEALLKAVPVLGAAGGAAINTLFVRHFQDMARAHFTIRRLERIYGPEFVENSYKALKLIGPGGPSDAEAPLRS